MNSILQTLYDAGWERGIGEKPAHFTHPSRKGTVLLDVTKPLLSANDLLEVSTKARVTFPDAPEVQKQYYLKLDISKYFYRISHDVVLREFNRKVSDPYVREWMKAQLCNNNVNFGLPRGKRPEEVPRAERIPGRGVPVGSLNSQMLANFNLNPADQHAKRDISIKYYVRYNDDIIILSNDKQQLKSWKDDIERFINEKLGLDLNEKVCLRPISLGIEFCGCRIWSNHIKLRKSTALHMKHNLKAIMEEYADGEINLFRAQQTISAYIALLSHCNSYRLRREIFGEYTEDTWYDGWFKLQFNSEKMKEPDE